MSLVSTRFPVDWQPAHDSLIDRVIVVTGAYGGLGAAVARAVSRAGATVVITGRRKRQLEQLYDAMLAEGLPEPVIHPLDMEVATPNDYAAMADGLQRDFGLEHGGLAILADEFNPRFSGGRDSQRLFIGPEISALHVGHVGL